MDLTKKKTSNLSSMIGFSLLTDTAKKKTSGMGKRIPGANQRSEKNDEVMKRKNTSKYNSCLCLCVYVCVKTEYPLGVEYRKV